MGAPTVSVSIITRDRTEELEGVLRSICSQDYQNYEIIVGDNGSQPENLAAIESLVSATPKARLVSLGGNLGVAGGRTAILQRCTGKYIVELDDDSLLANNAVFSRAVAALERDPSIGILAFKILNYHTGTIDRHEFPFLAKGRDPDLPGESAWFIGCGHFFTRKLFEAIGGYRDFFPYGAEELDYSFRALDAGYRIVYLPELVVLHKKSLKHRIVDPVQWGALSLKHRLKAVTLNLPFPFWLTSFAVRGFLYSGCLRHPRVITKAIHMLSKEWGYVSQTRRSIRWSTVWRILKLRGPVFF